MLSWQEHLTKDDIPPLWMWHLDHELDRWFEMLDDERRRGSDGSDRDEEPPMMRNELAEHVRRQAGRRR